MSLYATVKKFLGDEAGWARSVRSQLRANGKTQAALAAAVGMDPSQLNRYLTQSSTPSMETMLRIEQGLEEICG